MRATQRPWIHCYCVTLPMMWTALLPLIINAESGSIDAVWKAQCATPAQTTELDLRDIGGRSPIR